MWFTRQKIAVTLLVLLLSAGVRAARTHIYGRVTSDTGDPVELATINEANYLASGITNLKGEYSITIWQSDTITLVFRALGHETRKRTLVSPSDTVELNVMLPHSGYALEGVTIRDSKRQMGANQEISPEGLDLVASAGGGAVERLVAMQAGVSSKNELSSQYSVRGGNFDENLVMVNGTEILRPILVRSGNQEGLSFIDPHMVETINFSSGGFEAIYTDKFSSVLDITYRKPKGFQSTLQASLLGGNIYMGGGGGKFQAQASLRYKQNRSLLGSMDTQGEYDPSFLDFQAHLNWQPSVKWEIGLLANAARNSYNFTPVNRTTSFGTLSNPKHFTVYFDGWETDRFNTMFSALNFKNHINDGHTIAINLSAFDSDERESLDINSEYWMDQNPDMSFLSVGRYKEHARNHLYYSVLAAQLKGEHLLTAHKLQWGLEYKHEAVHDSMREWEIRDSAGYSLPFNPQGQLGMYYNLKSKNRLYSNVFSLFAQDAWNIYSNAGYVRLNMGIRLSYREWNDDFLCSPRLGLAFAPADHDNLVLRFSTGIYYQAPLYKELKRVERENGMGRVTLNRRVHSQRSMHFIMGGDYHFNLFDRPFKATAELYYKNYDNLIPYTVDNVRIVYCGENLSRGYAAGLDLKLFGEFVPGTDSWITFSLMKTQEKIEGRWIPRPTDQLYNFSLYFTDFFPNSDRWRLNLQMALSDGLPFSPKNQGPDKVTYKSDPYRRIDIGVSYLLHKNSGRGYGARGFLKNVWLGMDCLNLWDTKNVSSYLWITDVLDTQYAVPNYLTGRIYNLKLTLEFGKPRP